MTSSEPSAFDEIAQYWRRALQSIEPADVQRAQHELSKQLLAAESLREHFAARQKVSAILRDSQSAGRLLEELLQGIIDLQVEWQAARRYTPAGVEEAREQHLELLELDPADATAEWLTAVVRALTMAEWEAAIAIADFPLKLEGDALAAAEELRQGLRAWRRGPDDEHGLALLRRLASGELTERMGVPDVRARVRAHRIAAWLCVRLDRDVAEAQQELDRALELRPGSSRALAERAALLLRAGDLDRARNDAHRSIEADPRNPAGHIALGACAEASGDVATADRLYRHGIRRLAPHHLATLRHRISLIALTGRMLLRLAERLLEADRPKAALEAIDAALDTTIADALTYPDALAYALRSRAVEELGAPGWEHEAAIAALEAGKRFTWSERSDDAREQLVRAMDLDASLEDTGWFLADLVMSSSSVTQSVESATAGAREAQRIWEDARDRFGWPEAERAWAYLTRAFISEYSDPGSELAAWEALGYVERALVHDHTDGNRWAVSARYLRTVGLSELALESIQYAADLGTVSYESLTERMALLTARGLVHEADEVAREIVAGYGEDRWLNGARAVLAFLDERYDDGLELVKLPLSQDFSRATYLFVAGLCHLGRGDRDAARDAYAAVLDAARGVKGAGKCQLAIASAVLGDVAGARRWLDEAAEDASVDRADVLSAASITALAEGDLPQAVELVSQAVDEARSVPQLEDTVREVRLHVQALPLSEGDADRIRAVLDAGVHDRVAARRAWLEEHPPSAAAELEDAIQRLGDQPDGPIVTALLAVRARRRLMSGDGEGAADDYERLLGSSFAHEARYGLRQALEAAANAGIAQGEVEDVRRIQKRLQAHGLGDSVGACLAVASALMAADRLGEAADALAVVAAEPLDDRTRRALHERAGAVELRRGAGDLAEKHFCRALEATSGEDPAEDARLQVRRAFAALMMGDSETALRRMQAALEGWQRADAFEPVVAARQEAVAIMAEGSVTPPLNDAWTQFGRVLAAAAGRAEPASA